MKQYNSEFLIIMLNVNKINIYALVNLLKEEKVFAVGMPEKSKEFLAASAEIYHVNIPESAKNYH